MESNTVCYRLKHRKLVSVDIFEWAKQFEKSRRRIRGHNVKGYFVSTVFLGVEHVGGFFETMIITPKGEFLDYQTRAKTHRKALAMHLKAKAYIKENV